MKIVVMIKKARKEEESSSSLHDYHHAHMTHSIGNMLQEQVKGTTRSA
jgi:hypothetical protein